MEHIEPKKGTVVEEIGRKDCDLPDESGAEFVKNIEKNSEELRRFAMVLASVKEIQRITKFPARPSVN